MKNVVVRVHQDNKKYFVEACQILHIKLDNPEGAFIIEAPEGVFYNMIVSVEKDTELISLGMQVTAQLISDTCYILPKSTINY